MKSSGFYTAVVYLYYESTSGMLGLLDAAIYNTVNEIRLLRFARNDDLYLLFHRKVYFAGMTDSLMQLSTTWL